MQEIEKSGNRRNRFEAMKKLESLRQSSISNGTASVSVYPAEQVTKLAGGKKAE